MKKRPFTGTKMVVVPYALNDAYGFPSFPLTVDIPARAYPDRPGGDDLPAILRWIADTAERDGVETISWGHGNG